MEWTIPLKPAELTENRLIEAILDGTFAIGSALPAERELAQRLKVTRPTLREALQRLSRDGWLEIRQGKPTRVKDFWREGSLGVLGNIARHSAALPADFIPNLLIVRLALAPAYTALAVQRDPGKIKALLANAAGLADQPEPLANFDWQLHRQLTIASGNPIFTLILNGFGELYIPMAVRYFELAEARSSSRRYYRQLAQAVQPPDPQGAERISREAMQESLLLWQKLGDRTGF